MQLSLNIGGSLNSAGSCCKPPNQQFYCEVKRKTRRTWSRSWGMPVMSGDDALGQRTTHKWCSDIQIPVPERAWQFSAWKETVVIIASSVASSTSPLSNSFQAHAHIHTQPHSNCSSRRRRAEINNSRQWNDGTMERWKAGQCQL